MSSIGPTSVNWKSKYHNLKLTAEGRKLILQGIISDGDNEDHATDLASFWPAGVDYAKSFLEFLL